MCWPSRRPRGARERQRQVLDCATGLRLSTIFFTVSEPGGPCPVPTVNGVNCYAVASVAGAQTAVRHYGRYGSVVQLISTGTPTYSVVVGSPKVSI